MSRIASFHPALTDIDATAQAKVTGILEGDNATYKYVKYTGSNGVAAGQVVSYVSGNVALDTVDLVSNGLPAGLAQAPVVSGGGAQYGFIQIKGVALVNTIVAGSPGYGGALVGNTASAGGLTAATSATFAQPDVAYYLSGTTASTTTIDCDFLY